MTLWGVAALDIKGAYHFSPLDARQIGKLAAEHKGTLLLTTPTFLRTYLRRCEPEDFTTLDVVVCGAEKLPKDLADAFEKKFGVRPVEGYGTTELSPLVSVNVPPSRAIDNFQADRQRRLRRPPRARRLGQDHRPRHRRRAHGRRARHALDQRPQRDEGLSAPAGADRRSRFKDGWYQTGDIAFIDDDGFIHITGRESRFSKIGGEMVPHIKIEEELEKLVGSTDDGKPQVAVTAVPDEKKGERLIVLHTKLDKTPDELRKGLTAAGLPNLFIPGADSFIEVEELPILGTGKLDLKGIKALAVEKTRE